MIVHVEISDVLIGDVMDDLGIKEKDRHVVEESIERGIQSVIENREWSMIDLIKDDDEVVKVSLEGKFKEIES